MPSCSRFPLRLAAAAALILTVACGGNETAPNEDHTPVSYSVLVDGVAATAPYSLTEGQTVRFRIKFFNAASEDLDVAEGEHFAALTFSPASLATIAPLAGHHYQFDVIGGTPGTGTVQVSYGHDALADETSFTPVAVTVQAAP
jgi:hypothetical protein